MISLITKLVSTGFLVILASPASAYFVVESGPIEFYVGSSKAPQTIEFDNKDVFKVYLDGETDFNHSKYVHLYSPDTNQPGTRKMEIPGSGNNAQLLGKIGYAYHFSGRYKTNISFVIKGPRPDLDRTCAMSIYFKPHARGVLNAVTEPFIHLWDKKEDICKVEHITGEYVLEPAKEVVNKTFYETGRGSKYIVVPAKMGVRNNFVITILPAPTPKMNKDFPLVENAPCFPDGAIEGYPRLFKNPKSVYGRDITDVGGNLSQDYKKTICKGKSLTIRLPDGFSYEKMQLIFRKPVKTKGMEAAYSIEFGDGMVGPGKENITNRTCEYVDPVYDSFQCKPIVFGNMNTGGSLTSTIIIKNEGDEPFFPVFEAWSNVTK